MGYKIAIVDISEKNIKTITNCLGDADVEIKEFVDTSLFLADCKNDNFDIILISSEVLQQKTFDRKNFNQFVYIEHRIPLLLYSATDFLLDKIDINIDDIITFPINPVELFYRIQRVINKNFLWQHLEDQNDKLEKTFQKNKQKTLDLFGKHIDLKKVQKEIIIQRDQIEMQNKKLEKAIKKNKHKTIELFGKHIDLKKAQKEIKKQKEILEKNNQLLYQANEKNKQKTIDLFGKHIDLKKAKKEIGIQKKEIEEKNKSITDSIEYASFIQFAVLPKHEHIQKVLHDYFVLFMPKDIVSGDFYWVSRNNQKVYIIAADSTGHGVPGAFMSMLGISLLNEIVGNNKDAPADEILNELREKVMFSLHQTGRLNESADGMDIAFCIFDTQTLEMQFAGAHNPLYIFRGDEFIEIKADRMPIGFSLRLSKPFTNNRIQMQKGDMCYMFSDGYSDQFGGEHGSKMRVKTFQSILKEIHMLPVTKQEEILKEHFHKWKGELSQIDDVVVFGFRI